MNPVVSADVELPVEEVNAELRSKFQVAVQFSSTDKREPLLDPCKYSKLRTVLSITAWVQRFLTNTSLNVKKRGKLLTVELMAAEVWDKMTQRHLRARDEFSQGRTECTQRFEDLTLIYSLMIKA